MMWIISLCFVRYQIAFHFKFNPTLIHMIYISFILLYLMFFSIYLDNAAIHHMQAVVDRIHATGAMVVFFPPYSPDFMPCEELFTQTKNWIRENDAAWQFCMDPQFMVEEAFLQVTDEQN